MKQYNFSSDLGNLQKSLFGLKLKQKLTNRFVNECRIPLGTKKPYNSYEPGEIEDSDIVWFPVNPKQATSILFLAGRGAGKTVIEKRFVDYFFSSGYRCIVFDPKEKEFSMAKYIGSGKKLHPNEQSVKLPIMSYIPNYLLKAKHTTIEEVEFNQYTIFAEDIADFQEKGEWQNFGMSPIAADEILRLLRKTTDFKRMLSLIRSSGITHHGTKGSVESRLTSLIESGFFDYNYSPIPLKQIWYSKKRFIPVVNFFQYQPTYINACVGKIMNRIRDICNQEKRQFYKTQKQETAVVTPTLVVADDAVVFLGSDLDKSTNISIETFKNALSLWRSLGITLMYATQSPDLLDNHVLDMTQNIIIAGNIGHKDFLNRITTKEVVDEIKQLTFDVQHGHTVEFLWLKEDKRTYETFFPFMSRCN